MSNRKDVLLAQIDGLFKSLKRIEALVTHPAIDRAYRDAIYGRFYAATNPEKENLETLKEKVEKGVPTRAQFVEAWGEFTSIKEQVQKICDQCLDYLGGIVVRKMEMDQGTCNLAEHLVDHFTRQTTRAWGSVMIVGQERLFDDVAQTTEIIRVQFPEWDICTLPFTAEEFGQLLGNSDRVRGLRDFFKEQKEWIRQLVTKEPLEAADLVEPDAQDVAQRTLELEQQITAGKKAEDLLTPDIQAFRQRYQSGKFSKPALDRFLEEQDMHLRCLFADVFAIYFLGPAYIYAHFYLRLVTTEARAGLPYKPCRAQRITFMMETLRRMDEDGKPTPLDPGPYYAELQRLATLWTETVEFVHPGCKPDLAFGIPYDHWFSVMYGKLRTQYRNLGFTGQQWGEAKQLGDQLLDSPQLGPDATLPVVLNAAWYRRIKNPDRLGDIEKEARELYDIVSKGVVAPSSAGPVQRGP